MWHYHPDQSREVEEEIWMEGEVEKGKEKD